MRLQWHAANRARDPRFVLIIMAASEEKKIVTSSEVA